MGLVCPLQWEVRASNMKQAKDIVKEAVMGGGEAALSLALGVLSLGIFPIPAVVYIYYIFLLGYVEDQARRWLQKFLTTWPRVLTCGAATLGLAAGAWYRMPSNPDLFSAELHSLTFSFWTLILTGAWLFSLCIRVSRELWKSQQRSVK
jgi:hypothetical protein